MTLHILRVALQRALFLPLRVLLILLRLLVVPLTFEVKPWKSIQTRLEKKTMPITVQQLQILPNAGKQAGFFASGDIYDCN